MIIILNPTKDSYVTDLQTSLNDASFSNVGQAPTIDLFKIAQENKKTKARGTIKIKVLPDAGDTITITDSNNIAKTFEFNNNVNIGANVTESVMNLNTVINNDADLQVTSSLLYEDILLLTQDIQGVSGETQILINNVNSEISDRIEVKDFIRFEHSAGLLNFDIRSFYSSHIEDYNESVFSNDSNYKVFLKLKDVGKSSTKTKDFKLKINILNNDFNEGVGSDTIYFSDVGDVNFNVIDSKENPEILWSNSNIVSYNDILSGSSNSFEYLVDSLDKDLVLDVTSYIHNELNQDLSNIVNKPFVVHFDIDNLFDKFTYFVKRFGSRDLKNKFYAPTLEFKIKDDFFENISTNNRKRYFNNEEVFYLTNIVGNSLNSFINQDINLDIVYLSDDDGDASTPKIDILSGIPASKNILGNKIYNYKGNLVKGIRKFTVSSDAISQIQTDNNFNLELSQKGFVEVEFIYSYANGTQITSKKEKIYPPENDVDILSLGTKNIRVALDILQNKIKADDSIKKLKFSFIDINRQYESTKVKSQLVSEDLGEINYSIFDVDTGDTLIEENDNFTKLSYNGEFYIANIFVSSNFKNKRVNFKFSYTDPLTGLKQKLINDNTIIRFK